MQTDLSLEFFHELTKADMAFGWAEVTGGIY
jgi:hypothetical protein